MNAFRSTALCAILAAFSAPTMQLHGDSSSSSDKFVMLTSDGSSSNPKMLGGNGGVYHGGKIPASIPKAPNSLVAALQNDDSATLKTFLSTDKKFDPTRLYNFTKTPIAQQLQDRKVMTPQEAADAVEASNCSAIIANHIAQNPKPSSKRSHLIGGNGGIYHGGNGIKANTYGKNGAGTYKGGSSSTNDNSNFLGRNGAGIYKGGNASSTPAKVPASTLKAPASLVLALKNDDTAQLKTFLSINKKFDLTQPYNFTKTPIAQQLQGSKVMTPQEAADAIGASNCSDEIENQTSSTSSNNSSTSSHYLSLDDSPEVADEMENSGMES